MRIRLAVTTISIAMLASPLAYGQAPSVKPSGPAGGAGARALTASKLPAIAEPSDALKNLAGGGYADPNYVPPGTSSKKPTPHRVARAHWARSRGGWRYNVYAASPYRYCYCYCDYY